MIVVRVTNRGTSLGAEVMEIFQVDEESREEKGTRL